MKEKKCKNCAYFSRNIGINDNYKYGKCICEKFEYGWSSEYGKLEKETDKFFYEDFDGYDASINVGEDFGCIHFEHNGRFLDE